MSQCKTSPEVGGMGVGKTEVGKDLYIRPRQICR